MPGKRVVVGLDINTGKFIYEIKKGESAWKRFKDGIFSVKGAIGAVFAGMALRRVASFGAELVKSAEAQLEAEAKLATALREKGLYTQQNMDKLTDYAGKMQYVALVQDEEIMTIQRGLVQYGMWGQQLERTTKLVLDMAASGAEAQGSVDLLGRAFNGATQSLSRYGVTAKQVKQLGGGFEGVLGALERLKGGMSDALSDTKLGNLKRMQFIFEDIKESIGIGLVNALSGVGDELGATSDNMKTLGASLGKITASGAEAFFFNVAAGLTAIVAQMQRMDAISQGIGGPGRWLFNLATTGKPFGEHAFDFEAADKTSAMATKFTERAEDAYQRMRAGQINAQLAAARENHKMTNDIMRKNTALSKATQMALLAAGR